MGAAGLIFFYFGVNIIISLCTEYAICVEDIYQPLHTPCDYLGEILKNKTKKKKSKTWEKENKVCLY